MSIYPIVATNARGLKPFAFFALLIIFVGLADVLKGSRIQLNAATRSTFFFYVVALMSLAGLALSGGHMPELIDFGTMLLQLSLSVGLVIAVSTVRFERRHLRQLVGVFLGVSALVSLYAAYQWLARMNSWPLAYLEIYNPSLAMRDGQGGGAFGTYIRPSAFFTEPSRLGQFLLTPTLLSLFLYTSSRNRRERILLLGAFLVTASAFILGFSMGAYIAMGAALGIGLLMRRARYRGVRLLLGSVGVVAVLSFVAYPILGFPLWEMIFERTVAHLSSVGFGDAYGDSPFARTSVAARLARVGEGLRVWWDHPLFGVGLNNFGRFFEHGIAPRIHSAFVQSLAEMGVLGSVAFVVLIFTTPLRLLGRLRALGDRERSVYLAVGLSLLGRAVWMTLAGNYILEFFWLDMALATILLRYRSDRWRQAAIVSNG